MYGSFKTAKDYEEEKGYEAAKPSENPNNGNAEESVDFEFPAGIPW